MAVTYPSQTIATSDATTNPSFSYTTPTGSDRVLVVKIQGLASSDLPTGITYNSVSLTKAVELDGSLTSTAIWTLAAPTQGANTVAVSGEVGAHDHVVTSVQGGHQTTPVSNSASASNTSGVPTVTVTSATDEMVFDSMAHEFNGTLGVGAGQTLIHKHESGEPSTGTSREAGASSVVMDWSRDSGNDLSWATCAVSIAEAAAAAVSPTFSSPLRSFRHLLVR